MNGNSKKEKVDSLRLTPEDEKLYRVIRNLLQFFPESDAEAIAAVSRIVEERGRDRKRAETAEAELAEAKRREESVTTALQNIANQAANSAENNLSWENNIFKMQELAENALAKLKSEAVVTSLTDAELSRRIAEFLDLWEPQRRDETGYLLDGQKSPRDMVNDPAMTVMLMKHPQFVSLNKLDDCDEGKYEACFCGEKEHSIACGPKIVTLLSDRAERALPEAFAKANGLLG